LRHTCTHPQRPRSYPSNPQRAEGSRHHSLGGKAPGTTRPTIGGLKARVECLIRNAQLHESKSFSIDDIFFLRFQPKNHLSSPETI
jgi:hypothetical protein